MPSWIENWQQLPAWLGRMPCMLCAFGGPLWVSEYTSDAHGQDVEGDYVFKSMILQVYHHATH